MGISFWQFEDKRFKKSLLSRIVRTAALLFILCLLCFPSKTIPARQLSQAVVVKVTDGDTIWVRMAGRKVKLRLLGIDTPEKYESRKLARSARRCGVSKRRVIRLGKLATHHAKKLLKRGEKVKVELRGKGYYRRFLAFVYLPDGSCFNERMVADGFACVYTYRGRKSRQISEKEFSKLKRLLFEARRNRRGLWALDPTLMDCLCGVCRLR